MQAIRYFLLPLSIIYKVITSLRNLLFDFNIYKTFTSKINSIGVGNLTVGGTGKTPVVISLIAYFNDNKIAVISRGYGRKTKGLIAVNEKHNATEIGDEPFMVFRKFRNIVFLVSEKRELALQYIEERLTDTNLIIFDDVFQHRYVKPKVNILLCDYERPFYHDFVLPMGMLRESRSGAKRAQIILVTKCPGDLKQTEKESVVNSLKSYCDPNSKIFFSSFENKIVGFLPGSKLDETKSVILISGIGNNKSFRNSLHSKYQVEFHFEFPDHHFYTKAEIEDILRKYPDQQYVTTEKDISKIAEFLGPNDKNKFFVSTLETKIWDEYAFFSQIQYLLKS